MNKWWNKISFLGLGHVDPREAMFSYREVVLLNRLAFIVTLIMVTYMPVEIIFNGIELVPIIGTEIFLFSFVFIWQKKRWYEFAKFYFLFCSLLFVAPMMLTVPPGAGNEQFLFPVAIVGVLLLQKKWQGFLYWGITVCTFYAVIYARNFIPPFIDIPEETLNFFYPIFVFMVYLMLFFAVLYFRIINEEHQQIIVSQKEEIEHASLVIAEKNKEITDSINYAKRIQEAILPPENEIKRSLPESFILYLPKDIVAGDFYWFEKVESLKTEKNLSTLNLQPSTYFIAAADCTGHGVPGALVSVVCSNALNRSLLESGKTEPGELLDKTRELVLETFSKGRPETHSRFTEATENKISFAEATEIKDGMDISLCRLRYNDNRTKCEIKWAGANNPLFYIKNNTGYEIAGNKQPVGISEKPVPFITHTLELSKGDTLFLFTDGFADQFGGPKGKKFKYTNLKKILEENGNQKPGEIHLKLESEFMKWKHDLEQVDDVCIIGIRI